MIFKIQNSLNYFVSIVSVVAPVKRTIFKMNSQYLY